MLMAYYIYLLVIIINFNYCKFWLFKPEKNLYKTTSCLIQQG